MVNVSLNLIFVCCDRWLNLQQGLYSYMKELHDLGIRDYQVRTLTQEKYNLEDDVGDTVLREMRLPSQLLHLIVTFLLALRKLAKFLS